MAKAPKQEGRRDFLQTVASTAGAATVLGAGMDMTAAAAPVADARPAGQIAALFDLRGKVAVLADKGLTGSREVALLLAEAGAAIVMADVETPKGEALVQEISRAGDRASFVPTDIEDEAAVVRLFANVQKTFGRLDILVYCAGVSGRQYLTETTAELWDKIQSVNLRGLFFCMREGVKVMVAAKNGGQIINLSSIGGINPVMTGNEAYGAARAGMTALTRDTALDYARYGIRANVVAIGSVKDRVPNIEVADAPQTGPSKDGPHRLPLGPGAMMDVAAATLFLASPASRWITGTTLVLDGGFLLT